MNAGQQEFGSNKVAEKEPDVGLDIHAFNNHMERISPVWLCSRF